MRSAVFQLFPMLEAKVSSQALSRSDFGSGPLMRPRSCNAPATDAATQVVVVARRRLSAYSSKCALPVQKAADIRYH